MNCSIDALKMGLFLRIFLSSIAVLLLINVSEANLAGRWRKNYDELFFSGRIGSESHFSPSPDAKKTSFELIHQESVTTNKIVRKLIRKVRKLMIQATEIGSNEIDAAETELAREVITAIEDQETCHLNASERMDLVRRKLLTNKRRKELYGDNPPEGLLLDQHMDQTVKQQHHECVDRIIQLRHLVTKDLDRASVDRIYRLHLIDWANGIADRRREKMIMNMAEQVFCRCPKKFSLTFLSGKKDAKKCFDSLYPRTCKALTNLHEGKVLKAHEPDMVTIMEAYKREVFGENPMQEAAELIDMREVCSKYDLVSMFDDVYNDVRWLRSDEGKWARKKVEC